VPQHYSEISYEDLAELSHYETRTGKDGRKTLPGLGQINLFIGPNNSGKSRFLRGLYKKEHFTCLPSDFPIVEIRQALQAVATVIQDSLPANVMGFGSVRRGMLDPCPPRDNFLRQEDKFPGNAVAALSDIIENKSFNPTTSGYASFVNEGPLRSAHEQIAAKAREALALIQSSKIETGDERHIYVPILRGLREFADHPTAYADRTNADYSLPKGDRFDLFTGHGLYKRLTELLLGDREKRTLVRKYEKFLSREFFDGQDIQLVPRLESDVVHVLIGDSPEKPIFDLGDGLQEIITLTFPLFTAQRRSLFFIEEPEVHLHPGMQRRLIELLGSQPFNHHQVFLTTHSNHLLDVASDYASCSVFLFRPASEPSAFNITPVRGKDRRVLKSLGARSSAAYLTNAVIWVEGVTDRLYIRELLRRYIAENPTPLPVREDTHYTFAEVGGSCVVHWNFEESAEALAREIRAAAICGDNFLVLDGDNTTKGHRVRVFSAQLGDRLHVLDFKEIENLLPVEAVRAAVRALHSNLPLGQENLIESNGYQKADTGLGAYLDATVPGCKLGDETGTIRRKVAFCEAAVEELRNSKDWRMSAEAELLCAKLRSFILEANGMMLDARKVP
jgi:hypothetical protein